MGGRNARKVGTWLYAESRISVIVFLAHLLVLACFSQYFFEQNINWLHVYNLDGQYVAANVLVQNALRASWLEIGWNPLQGLGGPWYPFNAWLFLGYQISADGALGTFDSALATACMTLEIFAAVWFFSRTVGLSPAMAAASAWLLIVLMMPWHGLPLIYPIMSLGPQLGLCAAYGLAALAFFMRIGERRESLLWGIPALGIVVWQVLAAPLLIAIIWPILALFALLWVLFSPRTARFNQILSLVIASLVMAIPAQFVVGLALVTPFSFFPSEFISGFENTSQQVSSTLSSGSILFQPARGWGGPVLAALGILGAFLGVVLSEGRLRRSAICIVGVAGVLIFTAWIVTWTNAVWVGPQVVYFEFSVWALYAVGTGIGLATVLSRLPRPLPVPSAVPSAAVLLALPVAGALYLSSNEPLDNPSALPWPPRDWEPRSRLSGSLAISVGAPYRGRVINVSGADLSRRYLWFNQHSQDYQVWRTHGADLRLVSAWLDKVPTLEEYSSTYSPALYLLSQGLQDWQGSIPFRNILTFGAVKPKLLEALGVRYVVSDELLPGLDPLQQTQVSESRSIFITELVDANTNGRAIEEVLVADTPHEALGVVFVDGASLHRSAIQFNVDLVGNYDPVSSSRINIERNGFRVIASSTGTSFLLLPFEFSSCFELVHHQGAAKFVPANILQSALVFEGRLDVSLAYRHGPFRNPRCRLEDARELRGLDLPGALARFRADLPD